jgi:predicted nuclease with TOPRIM domain
MQDDMQEQLTNRLQELKAEFEAGQKKLAEVEGEANSLRTTMLRLSGAIQVLEEELAKASGAAHGADTGNEGKAASVSTKA